jgi:hypothetical protein
VADMAGKRHPKENDLVEVSRDSTSGSTFPNKSNGRPTYASILFRSEVLSELGRDSVCARAANGGEPQSSNVRSKLGIREINEYW